MSVETWTYVALAVSGTLALAGLSLVVVESRTTLPLERPTSLSWVALGLLVAAFVALSVAYTLVAVES